jgi:SAM-dependent methyltransferase
MGHIYKDKSVQDWLHFIRLEEVLEAMKFFPEGKNLKILEIGGGDGYIASIFSDKGHDITSIDLNPRFPQSYPVQQVKDSNLDFAENTFDVIFSSNVLEHVTDLKLLFDETKRVAKEDALMIHVMPTPSWRFITSFWYFLSIFQLFFKKIFLRKKKNIQQETMAVPSDVASVKEKKLSAGKKIKKILLHPHGEYPSFIHEFYYFSKMRWLRVFKKNDFEAVDNCRCPLLYSGLSVFKFKSINTRRSIAKMFFSAGHIYILKNKCVV